MKDLSEVKGRFILPAGILAVVAFSLGVASGLFWAGRTDGRGGALTGDAVTPDSPGEAAETNTDGADESVAKIEEAITPEEAAELRRVPAPVVEEVRDENGLTAEEAAAKFAREHPEESAARMKAQEDRLAARLAAREQRLEFLRGIDSRYIAEDRREAHAAYLEALAEREDASAELREARAKGNDVQPELRARLGAASALIRAKSAEEREILLGAAARSVGVEEKSIAEFTALATEIISATADRRSGR